MGRMEEVREDGEDGGGQGGWGGWRRPGEHGGGQDTGMGPREGLSVLPGQHSAHSALRGPFCSLLREEVGQCTCSVLGEHLRGSLEQDMALLPLKPIPSCSQAGPLTDREPPPPPNHDLGHGCVGQGSNLGRPGAPWSWAHLSSPGSCWSRRQAGLGSPPGSAASGTPCNAAQHTPAGGSRSGLFWRPLEPPQDWDDLGNWGLSEGGAWHPRPQLWARKTLQLFLHPPPTLGLSRNEESLNILLETLLRLVLNPGLSEQQTPRVGPSCHPGRSAQLSPPEPL